MRRVGHITHMGDRRGETVFGGKTWGIDHLEYLHKYERITLKEIFRRIDNSHDSRTTKWKKLTTEVPKGL